jgi:hypothetical protein
VSPSLSKQMEAPPSSRSPLFGSIFVEGWISLRAGEKWRGWLSFQEKPSFPMLVDWEPNLTFEHVVGCSDGYRTATREFGSVSIKTVSGALGGLWRSGEGGFI